MTTSAFRRALVWFVVAVLVVMLAVTLILGAVE
jgi:hypothetical protein